MCDRKVASRKAAPPQQPVHPTRPPAQKFPEPPNVRDCKALGNVSVYARVATYGPSIQSCNAGILNPSSAASGGAASTVLSLFAGGDDTKPTPPGVRMNGEFDAANGFGIKFYPETAVFICGVAVAPHNYSVESTGSQVVVDIKDSPKPDLFTLNSDGSLTGSGSVTVNGKTMFGNEDDDGNLVFQTASNTCQLG